MCILSNVYTVAPRTSRLIIAASSCPLRNFSGMDFPFGAYTVRRSPLSSLLLLLHCHAFKRLSSFVSNLEKWFTRQTITLSTTYSLWKSMSRYCYLEYISLQSTHYCCHGGWRPAVLVSLTPITKKPSHICNQAYNMYDISVLLSSNKQQQSSMNVLA